VTAITVPIAVFLWLVGTIIYFGLPEFYSQNPGKVPSFYTSLLRRKIVLVSRSLPSSASRNALTSHSGSS
jgi:hypothetical protein